MDTDFSISNGRAGVYIMTHIAELIIFLRYKEISVTKGVGMQISTKLDLTLPVS